jgi:hypothetical protein
MLDKQKLRFVIVVLSIVLLLASVFGVYLDQHLEGFGDLNQVHAVSLEYQIILLVTYLFACGIYILKTNVRLLSLVVFALFILTFISSYSFTFSARTNSISTNLGLIKIAEIPLSENLTLESKWYGYRVSNQNDGQQRVYLLSRTTPLVLYRDKIERYIAGLGDCVEHKNDHCFKRSIAWP